MKDPASQPGVAIRADSKPAKPLNRLAIMILYVRDNVRRPKEKHPYYGVTGMDYK
jgi:hypothetical protein